MGLYLRRLNRKQLQRRISLGLPAEIEDMSIMSTADAEIYRAGLTERLRQTGFDERKLFEGAFDDMTDLE